jgi:hypothetical protein
VTDGTFGFPEEFLMSLHVVAVESLTRDCRNEQCCRFVEQVSLYEFHALFYQDPIFQKWILDHAVFNDRCDSCAKKIQSCHFVVAEEGFRARAADYLLSGQKKFADFLQSVT